MVRAPNYRARLNTAPLEWQNENTTSSRHEPQFIAVINPGIITHMHGDQHNREHLWVVLGGVRLLIKAELLASCKPMKRLDLGWQTVYTGIFSLDDP